MRSVGDRFRACIRAHVEALRDHSAADGCVVKLKLDALRVGVEMRSPTARATRAAARLGLLPPAVPMDIYVVLHDICVEDRVTRQGRRFVMIERHRSEA